MCKNQVRGEKRGWLRPCEVGEDNNGLSLLVAIYWRWPLGIGL